MLCVWVYRVVLKSNWYKGKRRLCVLAFLQFGWKTVVLREVTSQLDPLLDVQYLCLTYFYLTKK